MPRASFFARTQVACASVLALVACGGGQVEPVSPVTAKPVATAAPKVDVSAVPEPVGVFLVARIANLDATAKTFGTWAHLPLPASRELLASLADESVASAVDLSQPVDGALALTPSMHGVAGAFSIAVPSIEAAKAKLEPRHKVTAGADGQFVVEGIGGRDANSATVKGDEDRDEDEDDDALGCVLTPAPLGARLVCGDKLASAVALAPYLARTVSREPWSSAVHLEVKPEPLARAYDALQPTNTVSMLLGQKGPAVHALVSGLFGEIGDMLGDARRLSLDLQVVPEGATFDTRFDLGTKKSLIAQAAIGPGAPGAPPAAFWHLPSDATTATYGPGVDPKLWSHALDLVADALAEEAPNGHVPQADVAFLRPLLFERTLPMLLRTTVFGAGMAGVGAPQADGKGDGKADAFGEAFAHLGWSTLRVEQPAADVTSMLKTWAELSKRPTFAAFLKKEAKDVVKFETRMAPLPAGVALPKDAVHFEVAVAVAEDPPADVPDAADKPAKMTAKSAKKSRKIVSRTLHVLAVPDQGATWLAFGTDAKLLAQKALTALSTSPDAGTLKDNPFAVQAFKDVHAHSGTLFSFDGTMRRLLQLGVSTTPATSVPPIVMTSVFVDAKSPTAPLGTSTATIKVPRATIERLIAVVMQLAH